MAKNTLRQYIGEPVASSADPAATSDEPVVSGSLVTLPVSHAAMLDFRLRTGKRFAFPYSYLSGVELDPSEALVCRFASANVTIRGRGLVEIYAAVANHSALAVIEAPSAFDGGGESPYVEAITIEAGESDNK